jgi:hypothetical protein
MPAIPPRHTHAYHHGVDGPIFNEDRAQRPAIVICATTLDGGRLPKGSGWQCLVGDSAKRLAQFRCVCARQPYQQRFVFSA